MDDLEKRAGERRSGLANRRADERVGDRRMGDRRLNVDENLNIYKRQCEMRIDDFVAKLKGEMSDLEFNKKVGEAKSKFHEIWEKYKNDLAGAEKHEMNPMKESDMLKVARANLEKATEMIKNELGRGLEV